MKTKEWLKEQRTKYVLTQNQLAKEIGVKTTTIASIEQGQRLGSVETWDKIEKYFLKNAMKISYESEELIEEIREDIEEFGEKEPCILIYKIIGDDIFFTNYDFITDDEPFDPNKELNEDEKYIETTLRYALEVFEKQNEMF